MTGCAHTNLNFSHKVKISNLPTAGNHPAYCLMRPGVVLSLG
jgi:hypothetical protein